MCPFGHNQTRDSGAQDLLETNIRQRGDVGGSAKKVGLRIKELERLYGIQNGGDRKSDPKISELKNSKAKTENFGFCKFLGKPEKFGLGKRLGRSEKFGTGKFQGGSEKFGSTNSSRSGIPYGNNQYNKSLPKISEPSQMLDPKNSDEARERIESGMGI